MIRQADRKNLLAIAVETKALAVRARAAKLLPEEYHGGGFTISNLGMSALAHSPPSSIRRRHASWRWEQQSSG